MSATMYEDHEVLRDGPADNERWHKRKATALEVCACVVAAIMLTGIGFAIARALPLSWFG